MALFMVIFKCNSWKNTFCAYYFRKIQILWTIWYNLEKEFALKKKDYFEFLEKEEKFDLENDVPDWLKSWEDETDENNNSELSSEWQKEKKVVKKIA